jgi:hypothetical protein
MVQRPKPDEANQSLRSSHRSFDPLYHKKRFSVEPQVNKPTPAHELGTRRAGEYRYGAYPAFRFHKTVSYDSLQIMELTLF